MIKRQYDHNKWHGENPSQQYFHNFLDSCQANGEDVWKALIEYKATKGKSKKHYSHNVKWHDHELYTIFVLRYA